MWKSCQQLTSLQSNTFTFLSLSSAAQPIASKLDDSWWAYKDVVQGSFVPGNEGLTRPHNQAIVRCSTTLMKFWPHLYRYFIRSLNGYLHWLIVAQIYVYVQTHTHELEVDSRNQSIAKYDAVLL